MSDDHNGADDLLDAAPRERQKPGPKPQSAGAKVTVACNLPHGLKIRNFTMIPSRELVMGGGVRDTTIAEHAGEDILLNGIATEHGKAPRHKIVAGYAITEGVDKESWNHWLADNQKSPMVLNRCVFAYERAGKTEDAAQDERGRLTGLEPFKKKNDPRRPKRIANVGDVTEADERAA